MESDDIVRIRSLIEIRIQGRLHLDRRVFAGIDQHVPDRFRVSRIEREFLSSSVVPDVVFVRELAFRDVASTLFIWNVCVSSQTLHPYPRTPPVSARELPQKRAEYFLPGKRAGNIPLLFAPPLIYCVLSYTLMRKYLHRKGVEAYVMPMGTDGHTEREGGLDTGWSAIAGSQAIVKIVDTLLDMPPHREFNKSELAEHADVSRKSVHTHLDRLVDLGIVERVSGTTPSRYRFNPDNEVSTALIKLDAAVNNAGPAVNERPE